MSKVDFIHLHNHSTFSKFDGFNSISNLVKKAKEFGMPAMGLTDHGTFAGAISFMRECKKEGIKPICGMEAYMSRNHKFKTKEEQKDARRGNRHLNLYAKNFAGYRNICALSQKSSLEGYYYDPRIDLELLANHSNGVICSSACLSNVINWNLSIDRYDAAKKAVSLFKDIFKDDFYLEVMYHGIDLEGKILPDIQKLGKEMDVKICASNDCHYPTKQDAEFHETLVCISSGRTIKDPRRLKFPYSEFYIKNQEEMYKIFGHVSEYLTNTLEVAEKVDYNDFTTIGRMLLPKFEVPTPISNDYLEQLAWQGLKKFKLDKSQPHIDRLKLELSDLRLVWDTKRFDFASYFLIVEDVMRKAREKGIMAGVRGSGFGSLTLKCLEITEGIDPVEFDLSWPRFLGFDNLYDITDDDFGISEDAQQSVEIESDDISVEIEDEAETDTEIIYDRFD